jgi:hypothetical protein
MLFKAALACDHAGSNALCHDTYRHRVLELNRQGRRTGATGARHDGK